MHNKKNKAQQKKHQLNKRAQQEIAGFVLIVVLVVIALMVFLIISIRKAPEIEKSESLTGTIKVMLDYTTECSDYEPNYYSFQRLIKSCFNNNEKCSSGLMACDYLNDTLKNISSAMFDTESGISAYQIDILERLENIEINKLRILKGNCTGSISEAQQLIAGNPDLIFRLRVCRENI